jgi:pantoate--beta-alanine ligase
MRQERAHLTGQIGFVPTMGYLHAGHLSLFQQARAMNHTLIVSIFVNPTQFSPHEDFNAYPRDIERDLHLLEQLQVDTVFLPTAEEMYPSGFTTYVVPEGTLATEVEGAIRPNHFRGVATVVLKLFQIVQPHYVYFGQKDAQQVAVIRRMIDDLNLPFTLCVLPTMRETDGLAMSSRNSYLTPPQRLAARVLYQALQTGQQAVLAYPDGSPTLAEQAIRETIQQEPQASLEYVEIRDPYTFLPLSTLRAPALLALAVRIGTTRLIDNFLLRADGFWDTGTISSL